MNKTVAEFFAGIGLMRMGLDKAGWTTVWANDIDPLKQKMYTDHFLRNGATFVLDDIHNVSSNCLPQVDLATASFPCNDLSLAGSRDGLAGQHSSAFWGFIDILKSLKQQRPPIVLLENVSGFLSSNNGNDFKEACLALNNLGYAVDAFFVDAAHFVPQSRVRLFVIGIQDSLYNHQSCETVESYESDSRPKPLLDYISMNQDIQWSLRYLPTLPNKTKQINSLIEELPDDSPFWWSTERCKYLLDQMSDKHRNIAEKMISDNKISYGTVFRRVRNGKSMAELRIDGIAGCLRTPRGGSGRQILFVAGKGKYRVRLLTPRECARLMGAGNFILSNDLSLNQALMGFGDAVCVPAITWIAENYLNPVFEQFYDHSLVSCGKE